MDELQTNSLEEFLRELNVTPSKRTKMILQFDPSKSIEDTFGRERAIEISQDYPMYVGHLPVGEIRKRCIITDLISHGYKEGGWVSNSPSNQLRSELNKTHGPDNIIIVKGELLAGIKGTINEKFKTTYFFIKPYEKEPQYLEFEGMLRETLFESTTRKWEEKLIPIERGTLTVMEYGKPVIAEVYALGILDDLLFRYGTTLDEKGLVSDYKTIQIYKIQRYEKLKE